MNSNAPVLIVWDTENVAICEPALVKPFIRRVRAIAQKDCEDKHWIAKEKAFLVFGDPDVLQKPIYQQIKDTPGVDFVHTSNGTKNALDLQLINKLNYYHTLSNETCGCLVVIAGDSDFNNATYTFKKNSWSVVLVCCSNRKPKNYEDCYTDFHDIDDIMKELKPLDQSMVQEIPRYVVLQPLPASVHLSKVAERLENVTHNFNGKLLYINLMNSKAVIKFPNSEAALKCIQDPNPRNSDAFNTIFRKIEITDQQLNKLNDTKINEDSLHPDGSNELDTGSSNATCANNAANGAMQPSMPPTATSYSDKVRSSAKVPPVSRSSTPVPASAPRIYKQCFHWASPNHNAVLCESRFPTLIHPLPCNIATCTAELAQFCPNGHPYCQASVSGYGKPIPCMCRPYRDPKKRHFICQYDKQPE